MIDFIKEIDEKTTTRQLRQILFSHGGNKGDSLRRELFSIDEQDKPASIDNINKTKEILEYVYNNEPYESYLVN